MLAAIVMGVIRRKNNLFYKRVVERDVLAEELQFYFEASQAAELEGEDVEGKSARDKANWMLRKLENYGWIDIETDKSYVQRVNFKEYAVKGICIGASYVFLDGKHFVSAVGCEQYISILRYGQYEQVGADGIWRNKEVNNAKTADKKPTI